MIQSVLPLIDLTQDLTCSIYSDSADEDDIVEQCSMPRNNSLSRDVSFASLSISGLNEDVNEKDNEKDTLNKSNTRQKIISMKTVKHKSKTLKNKPQILSDAQRKITERKITDTGIDDKLRRFVGKNISFKALNSEIDATRDQRASDLINFRRTFFSSSWPKTAINTSMSAAFISKIQSQFEIRSRQCVMENEEDIFSSDKPSTKTRAMKSQRRDKKLGSKVARCWNFTVINPDLSHCYQLLYEVLNPDRYFALIFKKYLIQIRIIFVFEEKDVQIQSIEGLLQLIGFPAESALHLALDPENLAKLKANNDLTKNHFATGIHHVYCSIGDLIYIIREMVKYNFLSCRRLPMLKTPQKMFWVYKEIAINSENIDLSHSTSEESELIPILDVVLYFSKAIDSCTVKEMIKSHNNHVKSFTHIDSNIRDVMEAIQKQKPSFEYNLRLKQKDVDLGFDWETNYLRQYSETEILELSQKRDIEQGYNENGLHNPSNRKSKNQSQNLNKSNKENTANKSNKSNKSNVTSQHSGKDALSTSKIPKSVRIAVDSTPSKSSTTPSSSKTSSGEGGEVISNKIHYFIHEDADIHKSILPLLLTQDNVYHKALETDWMNYKNQPIVVLTSITPDITKKQLQLFESWCSGDELIVSNGLCQITIPKDITICVVSKYPLQYCFRKSPQLLENMFTQVTIKDVSHEFLKLQHHEAISAPPAVHSGSEIYYESKYIDTETRNARTAGTAGVECNEYISKFDDITKTTVIKLVFSTVDDRIMNKQSKPHHNPVLFLLNMIFDLVIGGNMQIGSVTFLSHTSTIRDKTSLCFSSSSESSESSEASEASEASSSPPSSSPSSDPLSPQSSPPFDLYSMLIEPYLSKLDGYQSLPQHGNTTGGPAMEDTVIEDVTMDDNTENTPTDVESNEIHDHHDGDSRDTSDVTTLHTTDGTTDGIISLATSVCNTYFLVFAIDWFNIPWDRIQDHIHLFQRRRFSKILHAKKVYAEKIKTSKSVFFTPNVAVLSKDTIRRVILPAISTYRLSTTSSDRLLTSGDLSINSMNTSRDKTMEII